MSNLKRAYDQMKAKKSQSLVNSSLAEHFKKIKTNEWHTDRRNNYNKLYPLERTKSISEKALEYEEYKRTLREDEIPIGESEYEYSKVKIEYEYCEWVEPVKEVKTIDENGVETIVSPAKEGYYTPNSCTLTYNQWLGNRVPPEFTVSLEIAEFKSTDREYRKYFKIIRAREVSEIRVTINGREYDGDETSQTRISRAISTMTDTDTIVWVLASNNAVQTTKAELIQVLRLAGIEQSRLWTMYRI